MTTKRPAVLGIDSSTQSTKVVARDLEGAFRYFGAERLTTVRVPTELGVPNLLESKGAATVRASRPKQSASRNCG